MNTPPPPPPPLLYPFYSPPGSPFTIHTPDSEASFDRYSGTYSSGHHSNASLNRPQSRPKIETRQPSHPGPEDYNIRPVFSPSESSSAMASTANRDLLYFVYQRNGDRWQDDPLVDEIPAPQAQIRKRVEQGNKRGTALQHLERMGPFRRSLVERHIQILNASETDGSTWEPVYIDNTDFKRQNGKAIVKKFQVIFERHQLKIKRHNMPSAPAQPPKPEPQEDKVKKEKRKSKDVKAEKPPMMRGALVDDPFGNTQWFDMTGATAGRQGHNNTGTTELPPFIPPEKPIGTLQPRIVAGLDPETDEIFRAMHSMPGAFDHDPTGHGVSTVRPNLAARMARGADDDVVAVDDDEDYQAPSGRQGRHHRRQSNLTRSTSGRRGGQRQGSHSRNRNVRFSGHFEPGFAAPPSSGSSMVSGDFELLFDEAEELSSRTSEETSGSPAGPKIYRPVGGAYRQHHPGPSQPSGPRYHELAGKERVLMPERSQRRSSQATAGGALATPHGVEQLSVRRKTSPQQILTATHRKPLVRTTSEQPQVQTAYAVEVPHRRKSSVRYKTTVHQQGSPQDEPHTVPPIAVYPQYFEGRENEERDHEMHAHNYMRDTVRQRTLHEYEEELTQKEQALLDRERQALRDEEKRQRETVELRDQLESLRLKTELGQRRSVYTHEPRDFYKAKK